MQSVGIPAATLIRIYCGGSSTAWHREGDPSPAVCRRDKTWRNETPITLPIARKGQLASTSLVDQSKRLQQQHPCHQPPPHENEMQKCGAIGTSLDRITYKNRVCCAPYHVYGVFRAYGTKSKKAQQNVDRRLAWFRSVKSRVRCKSRPDCRAASVNAQWVLQVSRAPLFFLPFLPFFIFALVLLVFLLWVLS